MIYDIVFFCVIYLHYMLCYCNVLCISWEYTAKSEVRFLLLYFYSYFHIILGSKIDNDLSLRRISLLPERKSFKYKLKIGMMSYLHKKMSQKREDLNMEFKIIK